MTQKDHEPNQKPKWEQLPLPELRSIVISEFKKGLKKYLSKTISTTNPEALYENRMNLLSGLIALQKKYEHSLRSKGIDGSVIDENYLLFAKIDDMRSYLATAKKEYPVNPQYLVEMLEKLEELR